MRGELDLLDALSQPLRAFVDPAERVWWVFLLGALAMPVVAMGLRRGALALRHGLLRGALWLHPSSRADVTLLFAKAIIAGALRIPWLAATTGAALWVALSLHGCFGQLDAPAWSRGTITAIYSCVLFVAWDLSRFALHLAMHRSRVLWSFHQVHHSATVLTPLTLYRTHPIETVLFDLRGMLVTASVSGVFMWLFPGRLEAAEVLGVSALGMVFNFAGANLRHSHVWLRFGPLERWIISPAQHQLHHARELHLQSRNLGTWLAIWDRLAGSWSPAPLHAPAEFGLDDANHHPEHATSMLVGPLRELLRGLGARRTTTLALALLLAPQTLAAAEPPVATDDRQRRVEGPGSVPWPEEPDVAAPAPSPEPTPPTAPRASPPPASDGAPDTEHRTIVVGSMFDGELSRVPGSAHVVSERELTRREQDDVHKILADVPGVYVRGEDGFGLRPNIGLRGANPDRSSKINLMEDGVLLGPAPYSAPAAYYFPLVTRMVGVEVFKGPSSIRFGPNTIGGAINLRTRDIPRAHSSVVDLAGGRFGYFKAHGFYGTTWRGFGVLVEAARVQTQGFKELDGGGDTGFGKNDAMVKLSYEHDDGRSSHRVEAKVGFANEDSDETYLGITRGDFGSTPYRRYAASARDNMRWWRTQAELAYVYTNERALELDLRAYRHDFDRTWRRLDAFRGGPALADLLANPDAGQAAVYLAILRGEQDAVLPQQALLVARNARRFVSEGGQVAFRWRPHGRIVSQELELGARVHHDFIDRDHTADAFLMTSGVMLPEGTPALSTADNRGEAVAAAFHAYDAITLWDRLTIAPGVRVEVIQLRWIDRLADMRDRRLDTAVTPGIGTSVLATHWLVLFAGAHRGFSPVTPGQPDAVKPETSMSYELGARARGRGFAVEAVGFVNDYGNLNGVCTFSSGCGDGDGTDQYSAGKVLVWGAELLARWRHRFVAHALYLELGASYTYTGSRFREDFSSAFPQWGDVTKGDRLPYVPEHIAGGIAVFGGPRFEISAMPHYSGAMRDVAGRGPIPERERVDGFFVLDVAAELRVLERLRLYTQLTNITANDYVASLRPFGARPGAPLSFVFGVKALVL
ncbi:MAG TPA: TonB-dependent receptor [Nannocystaceae bacterium]|nr:TonB-dependent receptor [Nannocystaceae bacterium]